MGGLWTAIRFTEVWCDSRYFKLADEIDIRVDLGDITPAWEASSSS